MRSGWLDCKSSLYSLYRIYSMNTGSIQALRRSFIQLYFGRYNFVIADLIKMFRSRVCENSG